MIRIINQQKDWHDALKRVGRYDFYHTYEYHLLEKTAEDKIVLIEFNQDEVLILLPLILRPIPLILKEREFFDATSVYGYAGPLVRGDSLRVLEEFKQELQEALASKKVISVFSRLHPLLTNTIALENLGEVSLSGSTISIDLTLPLETQWMNYRKNNRYDIRKLIDKGIECRELDWKVFGDEFVSIYNETMRRVGAQQAYLFPKSYYDKLFDIKEASAHLFGCFKEGTLISAGIFMLCQGIVQYHLSGTKEEAMSLSPTRLMLDTVRVWGNAHGAQVMHLGGGLGGNRDSLFNFKAGFSDQEHDFKVWRWVVDSATYAEVCKTMGRPIKSDFFPSYRAPDRVRTENA